MRNENKYFILDRPEENSVKGIIKKVIYTGATLGYKVLLNTIRPSIVEKKYNVAVCAIFKNEALYLREWIEFNHLVGVEHFYMYNNNSEDDYISVLQPYMDSGLVTLIDWPYNQKQMESYKDCIKKYAGETKWLGFIDIDEFIVPKSTDNIYDFLKRFEKNRGSVKIYWKVFGTSGIVDRNVNGLVAEDFTVCWSKYDDVGKCFYNTAYEFSFDSRRSAQLHHNFWATWRGKELPPVNVFDYVCIGNINKAKTQEFPIQINHYFTKSYTEYAMKRARGDVYFKINPHDEEYFYKHEMKCASVDYSSYKYLIKLKKRMQEE